MNLIDVIALAKAGYKKKDIDDLLSIEMPSEAEAETGSKPDLPDKTEEAPEIAKQTEEPDYKSLYEQEKATSNTLRDQLSAAQKENISKDISNRNDKSDEETLIDIITNFK